MSDANFKQPHKKSRFNHWLVKILLSLLITLIVLNVAFLLMYYYWLVPTFNLNFLNSSKIYNWVWLEVAFGVIWLAWKLKRFVLWAIFLALAAIVTVIVLSIYNL